MKNKIRYCYAVFCNPEPKLLYAVFQSKKSALAYAKMLIKWREDRAKERNWEFGYYHYEPESRRRENEFDKREKYIFSCCLKIKDKAPKYSEDATYIQVIRRPLLK